MGLFFSQSWPSQEVDLIVVKPDLVKILTAMNEGCGWCPGTGFLLLLIYYLLINLCGRLRPSWPDP